MIDAGADAREAVGAWLRLAVGDPACNDARDTIARLGRDELQRAAAVDAGPAQVSTTDSDLAGAMHELRSELDELEAADGGEPGLFGRLVTKVPGVGSPAERHARRLASVRPRIESMLQSLEVQRAALSRDNVTLRADLERLHEIEADLTTAAGRVTAYADALEFAVDVEVPELDPRRPLFEDELLAGCRARTDDLERAAASNRAAIDAVETTMTTNRAVIREIETLTRSASNRLENR